MTLLTGLSFASPPSGWPPFLRAPREYPPHIANAVGRLWNDPTFTRTVRGEPAPVPLAFYLRFVDAPDVAAAAARHLGLTTYEVRARGDAWWETTGGGAQGVFRVLARDGGRRVLLSWGTHRGSILGTIGGSALTQLTFGDDDGRVTQRLDVNAIIDAGLAAGLTRPFLLLFGWFVDRKLGEALRTAAAAAAWAHANPTDFCAWLDRTVTGDRRAEALEVFHECGWLSSASPELGRSLPDDRARDLDNGARGRHRVFRLAAREDFGGHAPGKAVRIPRRNVVLVELSRHVAQRGERGMARHETFEQLGDGMADHQTLAGEIVEGLQRFLGRLLAHEATLCVEALARAERGKRQVAFGLGEPARRFGLRPADEARSLRGALA